MSTAKMSKLLNFAAQDVLTIVYGMHTCIEKYYLSIHLYHM